MPDLQLNYAETPPWLKNDAVESNFLRDVEAGQRINAQRQQLPLKLKAMQQDVQMQDLKIGETIRQRDDLLQAEREAQGLGDAIAPFLDQQQPDKAMSALLAAGVRKPILFKSPQWQTMMKEVQAAVTAQRAQKQLDSLNEFRRTSEEGKNLRAQEANDVKLQIEQAKMDLATDPNNPQFQFKLANLYARLQGLDIAAGNLQQREAGTELRRNAAVQGAVTKEADLAEKGFTPTMSLMPPNTTGVPAQPQGAAVGQPLITPTARPLTTAAVTQQQESLIAAHSALSQASKLEPLINSGTFGPAAFVGSLVIDKGLANIYPELLNKERVEARVVAAGLRAATVKAVRSDSNITETEREDIIDDIPSPKKFLDSPARALVQLKTINAGIIDRAIRAARNLKQPVDSILAPIGDSALIKSLFQTGAITEEEAKDWGRAHLPAQ